MKQHGRRSRRSYPKSKLFLDANIIFTAAHNPTGKSALIIELSRKGHWRVASCSLAFREAERNLGIKSPSAERALRGLSRIISLVPTVLTGDCPIMLPDKDRPIILSALQAKCTHLLTGDIKDFGPHMNQPEKTGGLLIQTVSDFLAKLE